MAKTKLPFFWTRLFCDPLSTSASPRQAFGSLYQCQYLLTRANPQWTWGLLLVLRFSSLTSSLSSLFPSPLSAFPSKVILPFPITFSWLFKDVSSAPSLALHNGVVFWFWKVLPFFPHWMVTKLIWYCGSVSALWRAPVVVSTALFSFAAIYSPLKVSASPWCTYSSGSKLAFLSSSFHFSNTPGVQVGPLWRLSLLVKYWFSCCSNWSSDFSFPNISL